MTFSALGDIAVVVTLGEGIDAARLPRVRALTAALERERPAWLTDVVAAYSTVTVYYIPTAVQVASDESAYDGVCRYVSERAKQIDAELKKKTTAAARVVDVPVCYGGEFGPDLDEVARHCGLSTADVVKQHAAADYLVHAIGFSPGFPYLGGLPATLATPRRITPRTRVPAGSVGIGGAQTGIYPLATPGGWQLIGRTPLPLFCLEEPEPARLRVGDKVKFRAITREEFAAWK